MEDESEDMDRTSERSKVSTNGARGGRVGRSRTLLLSTRRAGSRIRIREKENEEDDELHTTIPRSPELKWMREIRSERSKSTLSRNQRASLGSLFPHVMQQSSSSQAPSPGLLSPTIPCISSSKKTSKRGSSPHMTEPKSHGKAERLWSGRGHERRSKSVIVREPRRRSSSALSSSPLHHVSSRETMLQESKSSSRDSDGSRGRSSLSCELGRSVSDRTSRLRTGKGFGSRREGNVRSSLVSPTRSPQSNRLRHTNVELAMALPEEDTIEQMFKLKSDCSGSETETLSMKGIVSSLIAIENEEM